MGELKKHGLFLAACRHSVQTSMQKFWEKKVKALFLLPDRKRRWEENKLKLKWWMIKLENKLSEGRSNLDESDRSNRSSIKGTEEGARPFSNLDLLSWIWFVRRRKKKEEEDRNVKVLTQWVREEPQTGKKWMGRQRRAKRTVTVAN